MSTKTKTEELRTLVLEAVARGWCADVNRRKTMDVDLAIAIANEVLDVLRADPSAVIAALGGTQIGVAAIYDAQWVFSDDLDDDPHGDRPVWVLGE